MKQAQRHGELRTWRSSAAGAAAPAAARLAAAGVGVRHLLESYTKTSTSQAQVAEQCCTAPSAASATLWQGAHLAQFCSRCSCSCGRTLGSGSPPKPESVRAAAASTACSPAGPASAALGSPSGAC